MINRVTRHSIDGCNLEASRVRIEQSKRRTAVEANNYIQKVWTKGGDKSAISKYGRLPVLIMINNKIQDKVREFYHVRAYCVMYS